MTPGKKSPADDAQQDAPAKIDELIAKTPGWRGERLQQVRDLIREAVPDVVETWKWMGSPVWESHGIICVGNAHKDKVKLTFPQGAQLADASSLFNNGLGGKAWRAIDIHEGDELDPRAFVALVKEAAGYNARGR